jgi:hypothetical protein
VLAAINSGRHKEYYEEEPLQQMIMKQELLLDDSREAVEGVTLLTPNLTLTSRLF